MNMEKCNKMMEWLHHNKKTVNEIRGTIKQALFNGKDLDDDMEVSLDFLAEDLALDYIYNTKTEKEGK